MIDLLLITIDLMMTTKLRRVRVGRANRARQQASATDRDHALRLRSYRAQPSSAYKAAGSNHRENAANPDAQNADRAAVKDRVRAHRRSLHRGAVALTIRDSADVAMR